MAVVVVVDVADVEVSDDDDDDDDDDDNVKTFKFFIALCVIASYVFGGTVVRLRNSNRKKRYRIPGMVKI